MHGLAAHSELLSGTNVANQIDHLTDNLPTFSGYLRDQRSLSGELCRQLIGPRFKGGH